MKYIKIIVMLFVVVQSFFAQGADQPKLNLGYNPGSGTRSYASGGGEQQPVFPGLVLSEKEQLAADLAAIAEMEAREAARLAELERKAAESRRQAAQKRAEYEAAVREEERRREFQARFEKLVAQLPGVERALILEIFTNAFEVEARLGQSAEVAVLDILGRQVPAPEPAPSPRVTTAASTVPQTGAPGVHVVRLDGGPSDAPVDKIKPAPRRQEYHSTQRHEGYVPSFAAASAPVRGAAAAGVVAPEMPPSYQEAVAAPMYPQISRSVPQARSAWDAPGEYQPGGAAPARTSAPTARMTRKEQEIKALQDFIALQEADLRRFDEWIPTTPVMQQLYAINQQLSQHQSHLPKYEFMRRNSWIAQNPTHQNYKEFMQLLPFYNAYNALLAQQAALNPQVEEFKKQRLHRELELTKKKKELSLKTTEAAQAARPVPAGMAAAAVGRAAAKKEASYDQPAYQPGGAAADPAPERRKGEEWLQKIPWDVAKARKDAAALGLKSALKKAKGPRKHHKFGSAETGYVVVPEGNEDKGTFYIDNWTDLIRKIAYQYAYNYACKYWERDADKQTKEERKRIEIKKMLDIDIRNIKKHYNSFEAFQYLKECYILSLLEVSRDTNFSKFDTFFDSMIEMGMGIDEKMKFLHQKYETRPIKREGETKYTMSKIIDKERIETEKEEHSYRQKVSKSKDTATDRDDEESERGYVRSPITDHMEKEVVGLIKDSQSVDEVIAGFKRQWNNALKPERFEIYKAVDRALKNDIQYSQIIQYMVFKMGIFGADKGEDLAKATNAQLIQFLNKENTPEVERTIYKRMKRRISMFEEKINDLSSPFLVLESDKDQEVRKRIVLNVIFQFALKKSVLNAEKIKQKFDEDNLWNAFRLVSNTLLEKYPSYGPYIESRRGINVQHGIDTSNQKNFFDALFQGSQGNEVIALFRILYIGYVISRQNDYTNPGTKVREGKEGSGHFL